MKEPLEVRGYWWLPDLSDNKLPGVLIFTQEDGARLDILGVFNFEQFMQIDQYTLIHGVDQKGKPITLYKCYRSKWNLNFPGIASCEYRAIMVFYGVWFASEADISFFQLLGHYTDIDAWINTYGFTIERGTPDSTSEIIVKYNKPQTRFVDIGDGIEAGIGFKSNGPNSHIIQTEVNISQSAYLIINSKTGDKSFDNIFSLLNTYSQLLQLGAQRLVYPFSIIGHSTKLAEEREDSKPYHPPIHIYFRPVEAFQGQKRKLPQEMLFTYQDLEDTQIMAWFQSWEKYETLIHLYRALFYQNRLFLESKFLNIVQALETLHSIKFGGRFLPELEFKKRKKMVLEHIPQEQKSWVESAIDKANYKPLKMKIEELINNKIGFFEGLIDDPDVYSRKVRDTRNGFVHQGRPSNAFSIEELPRATEVLTMLFEIYLLEVIGFSDEKIRQLFHSKIQGIKTGWKHLRLEG